MPWASTQLKNRFIELYPNQDALTTWSQANSFIESVNTKNIKVVSAGRTLTHVGLANIIGLTSAAAVVVALKRFASPIYNPDPVQNQDETAEAYAARLFEKAVEREQFQIIVDGLTTVGIDFGTNEARLRITQIGPMLGMTEEQINLVLDHGTRLISFAESCGFDRPIDVGDIVMEINDAA